MPRFIDNPNTKPIQKTAKVLVEEDWHKRLAHGHFCPICKEEIIQLSNCVSVYIVFSFNGKRLRFKDLFSRPNRRIVCPDCMETVREKARDIAYQLKIYEDIKKFVGNGNGSVKQIPLKKGDVYRDEVLKMNGIEPKSVPNFTVYETSNHIGKASGMQAAFLKVFYERISGKIGDII